MTPSLLILPPELRFRNESKIMRRRVTCPLVIGGVVLFGIACLLGYELLSSRVTARQFRAQIETELPRGTPRDQIEQWLSRHHIQFSHIVAKDRNNSTPLGAGGLIDAHDPFDFLTEKKIHFEIHWDANGKRTDVFVEERDLGF